MRFMRDYEFYYTQDGSIGLFSYTDDDVYHSKFGALTEAWEKFVIPSEVQDKLNTVQNIKVLDVCYGIGYNTKALMSFVINSNEKYLREKNIFQKIFYKIKNKKNNKLNSNTDSIGSNNINLIENILSPSSDSIEYNNLLVNQDNLTKIKIDCLEINEELVKISPLLKTVITPQEIFTRIVPKIFNCFDSYWKIKKWLAKISFTFAPKNKRIITELLDLKFNNDYDEIDNEYRINNMVNYILIDKLIDKYKDKYFSAELKKVLTNCKKKRFFDKSLLKYARFKQNYRYNLLTKLNLFAFLHNIYYEHLSKRYKKAKFKKVEKLFNINFHVNDARKSILQINEQYDYIFLDAFTFSKAPELWTVEFMAELYNRLSPRGMLMTYSNSALVRNTFLANNLFVGKIYNEKTGKFIGTVAAKDKSLIKYPLTNYEIGLCNTKAGIPYHDPGLCLNKDIILKKREIEFKTSDLISSSKYMKLRTAKNEEAEDDV